MTSVILLGEVKRSVTRFIPNYSQLCHFVRMTNVMGGLWSHGITRDVVGPYSIGPKIGIIHTSYAHGREVLAFMCSDVVLT